LRRANIVGTYALGMRAQAGVLDPKDPKVKENIKRDAALLMSLMKTKGRAEGLYDYLRPPSTMAHRHRREPIRVLACGPSAENESSRCPASTGRSSRAPGLADQDRSGGGVRHRPREATITISHDRRRRRHALHHRRFIHAGEGVERKRQTSRTSRSTRA